jgi:membrane protease YdiL (CAAX protease family)
MRLKPRLGEVNLALVSLYFLPAWGHAALRALTSPYGGFEDQAHAAVAAFVRDALDLGLTGLLRTASLLAAIKLVMAAAFLAYLIEFARGLAVGREPNAETVDVVLLAGLATITAWLGGAIALGDPGLVRQEAGEFLLLIGAAIVITIERHFDSVADARRTAAPARYSMPRLRRGRGWAWARPATALPACAPPAPRSDLPASRSA